MHGRFGLLALGCVVSVAVMVGVIGANMALGALVRLVQPTTTTTVQPTTSAEPAHMKPVPGRIRTDGASGVEMTAERDGGEAFFLANGTPVQVLQYDGPRSRVQVMDGPQRNRGGWLPTNAVRS